MQKVSHVSVDKKIMKVKYNLKDYMSSWLFGVQIDVLFDEYIDILIFKEITKLIKDTISNLGFGLFSNFLKKF